LAGGKLFPAFPTVMSLFFLVRFQKNSDAAEHDTGQHSDDKFHTAQLLSLCLQSLFYPFRSGLVSAILSQKTKDMSNIPATMPLMTAWHQGHML
jgi:hypothetical protein